MKDRCRRVGMTLLLAVLGITFSSCGGGGSSSTGPSTPSRTIVGTRSFSLAVLDAAFIDVSITGSGSGTLDATANWTFSSDDIDIYVTSTGCSDIFLGGCSIQAQANSATTKPERVTLGVTAGSNYRIWVVNFGPGFETGTLEVGLTK